MGFRDSERFRKTYSYFRPRPRPTDTFDAQETIRGIDWKQSVRIASTTDVDVTLAISPGSITTIDSGAGALTLADEDRILLKDQTNAAENGIYIWHASDYKLVRALDAVQDTLTSGAACYVEEGTHAQQVWFLTTVDPITVDSTNQVWSQIFGGLTGDDFFDSTTAGSIFTTGSAAFKGGESIDSPSDKGSDVFFYVSGSLDGVSSSLFGGRLKASGSITSLLGLSGSLTKLADGTSYLIAGSNITIVSSSNGAVTISSTASGGGGGDSYFSSSYTGSIFTTGSVAFRGIENVSSSYQKGSDVFFYVSGSISGSGANDQRALFGGDVRISGSLSQGFDTLASGLYSHAQGRSTIASGQYSHAEGYLTTGSSIYSHAEGERTTASGQSSHAEGERTTATGYGSHAEGYQSLASNWNSHAEGYITIASAIYSHAEGNRTTAAGDSSHAEGSYTTTYGGGSHAEGLYTTTNGDYSHAEGSYTKAAAEGSHAEGYYSTGSVSFSHAEGYSSLAGAKVFAIILGVSPGSNVIFDVYGYSDVTGSFGVGNNLVIATDAPGVNVEIATIVGKNYDSINDSTHITASYYSYDSSGNGYQNFIFDITKPFESVASTVESLSTTFSFYSHAEGWDTFSFGRGSHAEGSQTKALGEFSHAEGYNTKTVGYFSHAEGYETTALKDYSHAEGFRTIASGSSQHVQGKYNKRDNNFSLFVIGDGTGDSNASRSDIIRVNPGASGGQGSLQLTGSLYVSGTATFDPQGRSVSQIGADVYFFVSGSSGSLGTSTRGVAAFGGDVIVSGSLKVGTGSVTITSNDVQFGGANTRIEKSSSDLKFYDSSNPSGVTLSSLAAGAGAPNYWTSPSNGLVNTTGSVSIQGDLTVNGTTVTVNTTNLEVKDAVIGLGFSSGTIAQTAGDRGFIAGLSGADNATLLWKNTSSEFVVGRTTSSSTGSLPIALTSYANFRAANIQANIVTASLGFSGSHTKLADGTSFIIAGNNLSVTSASNGAITIGTTIPQGGIVTASYFDSATSGAIFTTGSAAFRGSENITSPSSKGSDVFFYVSGSLNGTSRSLFGGDVRVSGSINTNLLTASNANITTLVNTTATSSYFTVTNEFVLATDLLEVTGNIAVTNSVSASYLTGTYIRSQDIRANTLTGSLTKLFDGTSYLIAGSGIQITTGSNGAVTITNDGTVGDITAVTAGTGLTGGGTSGAVTLNINDSVVATVSGTTFTGVTRHNAGLSGSLTRLTDGTSYLIAGSNVTITTGSNGAVTISSTGGGGTSGDSFFSSSVAGSIFTTGSAAFRGSENITSPSSKGSDVFFYVSGSLNGTNRSLFGGDVRVSGSVNTNLLTASNANINTLVSTQTTSSYFTVTNEFVLATNVLEITGNLFVTNTMSSSFVTGTYIRSQDVRANTLTGSLTKLFDGTSYLIAGSGIQITTGSNGAVTITNDGTVGDITAVTAGTGLTGGGTSGAVTLNINDSVVATVSGTTFTGATRHNAGLSGSLTKLVDGTSYLIAGNNLSITTGSNGSVTIGTTAVQGSIVTASYFDSTTAGSIFTTGSAAFRGSENISSPSSKGTDVFFYVSGSLNGANKSVFGGDVRVSGSVNTNFLTASYLNVTNEFALSANVLEITGNLYVTQNVVASTVSASFLSGSLTRLSNGQSYLVAGNNVTIASQSNGSILISSTGGGGGGDSFFSSSVAGSIFTTGSTAFRGSENISSPSSKGSDVFFYVSGSLAGTNKSLFGGFVTVSGTMSASVGQFSQLTSSFFRVTDSFVSSADQLEITGTLIVTGSARVTGSLAATLGLSGSLTKLVDGTSYLVAGNNVTITSQSNGSILISSTGGGGSGGDSFFSSSVAGSIFTTGSAAFRGVENISSSFQKGSDVFFYVSGSISGSGANDRKALFGGDVRVSGSIITDAFIASGDILEVTGNLLVTNTISSSFITGTYFRSQDVRANTLTGSLTKLFDGTSYLIAGSGIQITTGSNGAVTITNDGTIGDITAVTAGTGLTGGGTSGAVTLNIDDSVVATVSGTTFTGVTKHNAGLSGSLTRLTDGTSYLIAGNNVTITSQSNGPITISSSPGGTNTNVQFNDGGLFGGVSGFTFDKTTNSLVVPNLTASIGGYFENIFVTGTASIGLLETRNQQSLMVGDKYIVLATGSIDHATLDGSGLLYGSGSTGPTVDSLGANAHILFRAASDSLEIFPNLTVTGSTSNVGNLSVTGSIYASKISGSITKLIDGSSYLIAGDNVSIVSQSNGSILISSTDTTGSTLWADGGNKLLATGSVSIDSSARFVDVIGDDVYFFVSGSSGSMGTSIRGVAAFGGDVMITGSLKVGTGSIVITSNDIQFGDAGTRIERSGNDIKFFDVNNPTGTTLSSMVGGGGGDSYWSSTVTDAIYATGSVAVRGGDSIFSANEVGTDVFFYVSGSKTSTGRPASGVAVLGGDLVLSGALYLGDSSVSSIYDSQGGSLIYTTNPGGSTLILGKDVVLNTNVIKANDFSTAITLQSSNVTVSGALTASLGLSGSLTQLADGTSYLIAGSNVTITSASNGPITISAAGSGFIPGSDNNLLTSDGAGAASAETNLNFDGSILSVTGSIEPGTDSTYNLGSPEKRWANVYTGDLHLKNDRGDWTLIEEEECLTVRNNVTGKRYKISMTPMD